MWKTTEIKNKINIQKLFKLVEEQQAIVLFTNQKGQNIAGISPLLKIDSPGKLDKTLEQKSEKIPLLGYISFDYKSEIEEKGLYKNLKQNWFPDFYFYLFEVYIFFESNNDQFRITYLNEYPTELISLLSNTKQTGLIEQASVYTGTSHTKDEFKKAVKKAIEYIRQGDIYQVNITRAIYGETNYSPWQLAWRVYQSNPISYGVFANIEGKYVISSSPERFFEIKNNRIKTSPIKGTSAANEQALKHLLDSEKEKAELAMIVDLLRNDISRICKPATVKVEKFRELIKLNNVYHTYADISGTLEENIKFAQLVKALFPGGSISGCPKIRACQVIEELEGRARGIYTGSFGYVYSMDDMAFNIMIRSIFLNKNKFTFNVGGGITLLSCPEAEFCETVHKAKNLWQALSLPEIEQEKC